MKAARLEAIGQLFTREIAKPVPGPNEVLVRVEAAGICGTDRHLLDGSFPSKPPVTIGHEFSGIIEGMGSAVTGFRTGMRITCDPNIYCGRCRPCQDGYKNLCRNLVAIGLHRDGGFAEYAAIPQDQAFELPLSLKATHGAFAEPLACCLHGIDMAQIRAGSSVVVLGGGVIGLLTVQLARLAGASRVILSTRQAARRKLAESIGATGSVDPGAGDIIEALTGPNGPVPGGADVVIECAGVPDTMQQMFQLARPAGTVVVLGVMSKGQKVLFEPYDILVRELRVQGSFINPSVHRRAAELIATGQIDLDSLITRQIGIDEVPAVVGAPPAPGEVKVLYVP